MRLCPGVRVWWKEGTVSLGSLEPLEVRASHCDDGQCPFPGGILVLHDFCFIVDFRIELLPLPRYDSTHLCSYVDDTFKGVSVNGAHAGSRERLEIIAHEEELGEPACTVQRKGDRSWNTAGLSCGFISHLSDFFQRSEWSTMSMYHGVDLAWCAGAHGQPDPQVVEGAALGGSEGVISAGVWGTVQQGCAREVPSNGNLTPMTLKLLAHPKGGKKWLLGRKK